ncbi:UNVERIFIED_CONTAM: Cyp3a13 [Trichonephila clavipes]
MGVFVVLWGPERVSPFRRRTRNDFLQLLMDTSKEVWQERKTELREKESDDTAAVYGDVDINHHIFKTVTKKNLSTKELVAQCIMFFIAGYDTTASTLSFATYMLALYPDIQEKVYEEIVDTLNYTNC